MSPLSVVVARVNKDGTMAWTSSITTDIAMKSLSVDDLEQNVYYVKWVTPTIVIRLRTSNGSFVSAQSL